MSPVSRSRSSFVTRRAGIALSATAVAAGLAGIAGPASAQGTLPAASISDVTVTEGSSGTTNATFTVTLDKASDPLVVVSYSTEDGSATTPRDYGGVGSAVIFQPGDTSEDITIAIEGDTLDEIDEQFSVELSSPQSATIADATGIGTIADDDAAPAVNVENADSIVEGQKAGFVVTLAARSGKTVRVNYATADGTAKKPKDYAAKADTVKLRPGKTTAMVKVPTEDDGKDEKAENFFLDLSSAKNATIEASRGEATIKDNDR